VVRGPGQAGLKYFTEAITAEKVNLHYASGGKRDELIQN